MIFALDIGTRKVAGILGEMRGDKVHIIDAVVMEHDKRAMLDGQIHNIEDVTTIVNKIKRKLEERNNIIIEKVTTALAGRSLHTEKTSAAMDKKGEITKDDLAFLELESVRTGLSQLTADKKKDYYCVGYSPVSFSVDGEHIKNPVQQLAKHSLAVETLVTFLPKPVLDSMVSVLKNCSLTLEYITLEPIAALYVTIPDDMRLLNLALVDVGAGTSDIAITEKNKITAYGMIPKAGDEITEAICHEYLVDFNTAERIKRETSVVHGFEARDIFNHPVNITYDEFKAAAAPKADEVAKEIADEILNLNGKQPQAVVMVGGGSSLQVLREKVAENLGLPINRVGSRTPESITNIENLPDSLKGTEGITPLGILETALFKKGIGFVEVTVNGEKEYIINLEQKITVLEVLMSQGMELKKLYGKPGAALSFTFNGELKILRGGHAEHSKVFVNETEADLDAQVRQGDALKISPVKDGFNAQALIKDIVHENYVTTVEINGRKHDIAPVILCNKKEVSMEEALYDRADIEVKRIDNIKEALKRAGFELGETDERDIIVTVNGEPVILKQRNFQLKVNGSEVSTGYTLKNMDKVEYLDAPAYYRIKDLMKNALSKKVKVSINGKPFELEQEKSDIYMNGRKVSEDEFIINGAVLEQKLTEEKMILSSIFKFYPINMERAKGRMLELKVNGEKAGYTTPIHDGAEIEVNFTEVI